MRPLPSSHDNTPPNQQQDANLSAAHALPRQQARQTPVQPATSAPVMRTPDAPRPDFFAGLPAEVHTLIRRNLASHEDRIALALVSRSQYAADQAERCLDFFLTHCHQISQLPEYQIADFSTSPRSQTLLQALPGISTLVDLYKLPYLEQICSEQDSAPLERLQQTTAKELQNAFRLFRDWTQEHALNADDHPPFIDADFLGSASLLERIHQLSTQESNVDTAVALTETLLTWTEHYGSQHLHMDVGGAPLPAVWSALGELTRCLMRHCEDHSDDTAVTPQLLLKLTGWCHFVQESGLLLPGAAFSADYASEAFVFFGVQDCVSALLKKIGNAADAGAPAVKQLGARCAQLASQTLARQIAAHKTQPLNYPHLASLRVFGVLMKAGAPAIAAATPEGLALFDAALEATHNEFARFAEIVEADYAVGFYGWEDGNPPQLVSDSENGRQFARDAVIGWTCTSELIEFHDERATIIHPITELMDKLYGYAHDTVRGIQDPLRGMLHPLSDEQNCQLRKIDSMMITFRELCLRVADMPDATQPALTARLQAIAQLWPVGSQRARLAAWIPAAQ